MESYVATLEVLDTSIAEVGNPGMTTINVADDDGMLVFIATACAACHILYEYFSHISNQ